MRGRMLVGASVLAGLACSVVVYASGQKSHRDRHWDRDDYNINVEVDPDRSGPLTSCDQLRVRARGHEVAREQEEQTAPRSIGRLSVSGAMNGPVSVTGTDRADYHITLCKFVAADTLAEAQARLSDMSLSLQGGRATVNTPSEQGYLAYVIVETPRDAKLDVDTHNGPLDLRSVSGQIVARATNGPVSVDRCSGEVEVHSQNGPVSLTEGAGHMRLDAQNGPLTVNLSGHDWQGAGLEASAHNGPLYLGVPEDYRSGVRVEISPHSPFSCHATACRQATRNWDENSRMLQFGSADPIVHVSATNGPVSIGSSHD